MKDDHRGVVSVVTGGGKTAFALLCMTSLRETAPSTRFVILVPSLALLDQWYVALTEDLGAAPQEIACFSGQEKAAQPSSINLIVLNTARTLAKRISTEQPTCLIVDECHRTGSPENAKALAGPHVASLGLSATPVREYDDGFESRVRPQIGDIIYEYGYREALEEGVISPFKLINVRVDLLPDEEREYQRLTRAAMRAYRALESGTGNEDRVRVLLQRRAQISAAASMRVPVAAKVAEATPGARTILFHERIAAANALCSILRKRHHRVTNYHSQISPGTRRDNLLLYRRGAFDAVVTCRALDEGLNVPDTSVAIIASSTASHRQRVQRLGRVLRPAPGKEAALVFTLFATEQERFRLESESKLLEGVASVEWRVAEANGSNPPQ